MPIRPQLPLILLAAASAAVPLLAHHSVAAKFDKSTTLILRGVVSRIEWMNPHARFYVDVKASDGKVTNWNFELGAIPVLLKQGWRKTSLKEGDQVTVEGVMAKDGTNNGSARRVPDHARRWQCRRRQTNAPSVSLRFSFACRDLSSYRAGSPSVQ